MMTPGISGGGRAEGEPMHNRLLCLDIETVPDRTLMPPDSAKFPKPLWHKVVAISFVEATIACDGDGGERFHVVSCRSGRDPDWDEGRLLESFWRYFAKEPTRIATWNGRSFDLPVLRSRAMLHSLTAERWYGAGSRYEGYTHRYASDWSCDLMDQLSDYGACAKLSLDETATAMKLPGKIGGHGSEVEAMIERGEIDKVRAYCECDTLNLQALYLRWALLIGKVTRAGYEASVDSLQSYLESQRATRPHMAEFLDRWRRPASTFSHGTVDEVLS